MNVPDMVENYHKTMHVDTTNMFANAYSCIPLNPQPPEQI